MAPYCAIPRDYLSDTPLLRAMGFLVSQHGRLGAIPPPPFLSVSPLESSRSGGAIPPPPQKGYLSDTGAIPYENKANGRDTSLCDTISKGYCAIWGGGISHWAAKLRRSPQCNWPFDQVVGHYLEWQLLARSKCGHTKPLSELILQSFSRTCRPKALWIHLRLGIPQGSSGPKGVLRKRRRQ